MTAEFVEELMAVFLANSNAPINCPKAAFLPPLPVNPFKAGIPTTAKRAMIPTTVISSTRVKLGLKALFMFLRYDK